ncbi:T9SS type A sorting domain-containing protein [Hymenobacter caeli]|uniref:Repeat protein (TIGR01451 family) n=1 Tax=Hymenobacter caeli TaxID=2735894 RepID=A0ABX2FQE7_9BACT|nr:T9SS type A sorting domain-containing protein [Hymenobacter caeli]NRT18634.1 putative repeat protein (TIGR01451 family) [Hymenobacter caeli]
MRPILRLFLLLLAWGALGRASAWAQACTTATSTLDYSAATNGDRKATTETVGGATTATTSAYSTTVTGGRTNTFAVGTNGNIYQKSLVWQLNTQSNGSTAGASSGTATVTYTFSRPVSNLVIIVNDIDQSTTGGSNFTDRMTFDGYVNAADATPITLTTANVTAGSTNVFVGSGSTGLGTVAGKNNAFTGTTSGNNTQNTNVTVRFPQPVTKLVLSYENILPFVTGVDRTQTVGIISMSLCRAAPVADTKTNTATIPTNAGQVNIDDLTSTVDGTVQRYTVTAIPPAAQGVLYYNSTGSTYAAVTNGQTLTPAQATSLRFDPAAGATGTSTAFSYTVTDDANLVSSAAIFTIPLQVVTPCVATAALDFSTRPANEDWKAHAAIGVPTGSTLTTIGTNGYVSTGNPSVSTLQVKTQNGVQTLAWDNTYPAAGANDKATVTFNFSRPLSNFTIQVQDIDYGNDFTDQVTFVGNNGGTTVTPVLSPVVPNAAYISINGNVATGTAAGGSNTSATDATVNAYFGSPITSLTITYANVTTSTARPTNNQTVGINLMNFCRLAPVANPITNNSVPDAAGQTPVNGLSSSVDGTVQSYTLTTLPAASQGVLYVNGTAATAGQTLTALQASQLTFDPAVGGTSANFTYTVTDDAGQQSATTTYNVPITATGGAGTVAACANPGRDGSPTGLTTNPNTYYPSTATQTVPAGATSIAVGAATGTGNIAAGDLLLVIQMQGADIDATNTDSYGDGVAGGGANGNLSNANFTAGTYEYVVANSAITATAGGTITLATALKNGYVNAAATATAGQRRFQVVRVPQFGNLTLGGNITPTAWNGSVGGIIAIDVAKQTNLAGFTIDASGAGFRGGGGRLLSGNNTATGTDYRFFSGADNQTTSAHGSKGEGTAGTPKYVNILNSAGTDDLNTGSDYPNGSNGRGAPGNAGGGGTDNLASSNNSQNSGGAGGANGGNGGRGGNTWSTNLAIGGEPGAAFAVASSSRLVLGGGGGAGSTNNGSGTPNNGFASSGATGGGLVLLRTGTVSGTGTILANGANANNTVANDGSGGGGAGGSILVTAATPAGLANLTLTANGGTGGTNTGGGVPHGPGGGGGGGIILTNGSTATASAAGAAAGTTNGGTSFGANPGLTGDANNQISNSVANSVSGASCPADVTTTVTGPTTLSVGQPGGSYPNYTATFTNNGSGTASNVTQTVTLPAGATVTAANLPNGATFSTTGTGATAVTTVNFGTATTLANGATNTFSFSFTAPTTAGSYPLTTNVGTDANQGTTAAPDMATLTIQVNNAPPGCGVSYYDNTNSYSGLSAFYYQGDYNNTPAFFSGKTPTDKGIASTVNYLRTVANTGGTFPVTTATVNGTNNVFSAQYKGNVYITTAGSYTFSISNPAVGVVDDRAQLYLDGKAVPASGTPAVADASISVISFGNGAPTVTLNLSKGTHNILLQYSATGQPDRISLSYSGPDSPTLTVIPNSVLCAGLGNVPPIATINLSNSPSLASNGGAKTITSLAGTDQDGTVTNYVITTLPLASQGVLSLGGSPVTAGQVITAAQAAQLQFNPVATFSGNATFTFQAVDNTGQYSNDAATYTIPVTLATSIAGTVFEDANYGGGNGRNLGTTGTVGRPGATVELYDASGNFVSSTTTAANGTYSLVGATAAGNYTVRVVNSTVTSARTGAVAGLLPVQTFVRNGTADNVNRVGGEAPEKQDAAANTGSQTLAALTAGTLTPESITTVSVANTSTPVSTVDFGYNFDVVTNTNDAGQGSLRQFITNSNALGGEGSLAQSGSRVNGAGATVALPAGQETSIFMIPSGAAVAGQRAGLVSGLTNGVAVITTTSTLPALTGANGTNTIIDGSTQTANVGNTATGTVTGTSTGTVGTDGLAIAALNVPEVEISGSNVNNVLDVEAANTTIRGLAIHGGTNQTISIGNTASATGYVIENTLVGVVAAGTRPTVANTISSGYGVLASTNAGAGTVQNSFVAYTGISGLSINNGKTTTGITQILGNQFLQNGYTNIGGDAITFGDTPQGSGPALVQGNLITNPNATGVQFETGSTSATQVLNNTITGAGTGGASGSMGTIEGAGIGYLQRDGTKRGSQLDVLSKNVITGSQAAGVVIAYGQQNVAISQNSISNNGGLAIDLISNANYYVGGPGGGAADYGNGDGVTVDDGNNPATAANTLPNRGVDFPVITSSTIVGTNLVVQGYSRPGAAIEFYSPGATGDPTGFGEGQTYLGTYTEGSAADTNTGTGSFAPNVNGLNQGTDPAASRFTFTIPLTGKFAGVAAGSLLSSTATLNNSTSEFSGNVAVNSAPLPQDVTNVAVPSNSGPVVLNPNLKATASGTANGVANTIVSYTVSPASTGTLYYNNVAVTVATVIPAANLGLLTYQPVLGSTTTATFTYTATDANGTASVAHLDAAGTTTTTGPATYTIPVTAAADVTTTIAGPTVLNPGQPSGTYTATFTNNGPNQGANVTQRVTLPAGVTSVVFPTGATYNAATRVIDFGNAAVLNSGATNTFTFSFTAPTTPGSVALTSNVTTATGQGADTAPNSATLNATVNSPADVVATITAGTNPVIAGQSATFNVNFSNAGPATAAGVVASVQLPAGLVGVSATNGGTYNSTTGVVTYAGITSFASGGSTASVITFTAPASGPVTATASISTTTNEAGQTANNTQSISLAVTPAYDVATTITGPTTTAVGGQTTFSVMTINNGPSTAPSVVQTVQLPTGLTNVYVSNGGTYDPTTGVVTFPALAALANGAKVDNTISFTPVATTGFTASATATAGANNAGDSNTANNSALAAATTVNAAPAAATNANIYTTITSPSANVAPGATTTFTVTSGNRGPATAAAVAQQTTLPAGLSNVVVKDANGTVVPNTTTTGYNAATGVVIVPAVGSVVSGATTSYTISLTAPAAGVVAAVATISSNNADPMPSDNIATADVTVSPATDVAIALTGPTAALAGQSLTYTATTTNYGPVTATNVVQTVAIPAGLTGVVVRDGNGNVVANTATTGYNSATGVVTFPTIASQAVGNSVSNTITYTAPASGTLLNVASVASATLETNAANNGSTVTTAVQRSSDVVVYLNGPATQVAGNTATYTVTTTNNGPSPAASETTTVQLVPGLANVVVRDASGNAIANAYNATTGVVTLATLTDQLPGAAGTVSNTITYTVPAGTAELTASANAAVSGATNDSNLANNSAVAVAMVSPATTSTTDEQTTVTSNVATQAAGSPVVFTVSSINSGPNAAANVVQTLTLPAGLTGVTVSNSGTYDANTGLVTFPTVASQASGNTTPYTVTVNAPGAGPLTAVASVSSATSDPTPANNLNSVSVAVTTRTDVAVTLAGPTTVVGGQSATYAVSVINNGPSLATSTTTVQFPAGLTVVSVSNGGTYNSGTGVVTFPAITNQPSGAAGEVTYSITAQAPATIPNGASFNLVATTTPTAGTNDQVTANNSASLLVSKGNLAPVANAVTNVLTGPQGNTANPLTISPLSGTDADGNLASYTITGIPDATSQGVLALNGVAVKVGDSLTPAQAAQLTFDPVATFVGNAFFTYTATDAAGAVSTPAIYTIPVGQDLDAVYTLTAPKGGVNPYQNGDVIANVFDANSGVYNNAAPQAVTDTGVRTATLVSGPLPAGTSLNPVTGVITVTDRTKLVSGSYPVTITTVDANGGVTTKTFTITIGALPLPVELVAFTAKAVANRDALLNWATASEKNSAYFDVERSFDGTAGSFAKIGQVAGQGSKTSRTDYALTDANVAPKATGPVYYRLKQVDADGTTSYSPVQSVAFTKVTVAAEATLYPNPATTASGTTLDLSMLPAGTYQVNLVDATGRSVATYQLAGGQAHKLDLQYFASGTYVVLVHGTNLHQNLRLVKE